MCMEQRTQTKKTFKNGASPYTSRLDSHPTSLLLFDPSFFTPALFSSATLLLPCSIFPALISINKPPLLSLIDKPAPSYPHTRQLNPPSRTNCHGSLPTLSKVNNLLPFPFPLTCPLTCQISFSPHISLRLTLCLISSNMSLLDQIFGTDGRRHKDEGIWNWVKNQKNKHKNKNSPVVLTRSMTTANPPGLIHSRSDSFNSSLSGSASYVSFTCSPTSPTSSFTPSITRNTHDPSFATSCSSSITSSSSSSPSSPMTPTESYRAPTPASARTPYLQSRQRTQSTFTLPSQQPMYQHSHQGHDGIAVNGPIKRSTSAKSAKTYYSNMSQESFGGGLKGKRGSIMQIDLMDDISETEKSSSSVGDSTLNSSHIHHSHHTNTANGSQRGGGYMSDDDKSRRSAEIRQAKRDGWWWE
ncbi:hypothetical protein EDD21DRAFT_391828 [Dissophora ornata]|nr:hypothetical protein EDD21DRAFT_391828 [Dissophora ornata]